MRTALAALLVLLPATPSDPPVEQTKKNIKVLQGLPSSQLIPVMAFMANSLGVTCAHCHAKEWESDEKPEKEVGRKMIEIQRSINEQQFAGKLTVTCSTCHQGRTKPLATPEITNAGWNSRPVVQPQQLLSTAEAIGRLPEVRPGVTSRVIRGMVERYNGRDLPKSATFTLTISAGATKYDTELSHPPEASRALAIYLLQPLRPEQGRDERWLIAGDAIRCYRETPTPLGNLPEQIDYSDFRDTDSGRIPFRAQWSRADYRVTFTVDGVQSHVRPATP